jgi:CelD/BcsL family acetyltransferase involved in cellulose biosynthesis
MVESFETLVSHWVKSSGSLRWSCISILPPWLETWWREFGSDGELYLYAARQGGTVVGIAPLMVRGGEAFFIGSDDLCDCLDFIVAPGREHDFFQMLLDDLSGKGISPLTLKGLRPDSSAITYLVGMARDRGYKVSCTVEDVSLELDLPPTWDEYLSMLGQKRRHEVRRKLRRIREAGDIEYRIVEQSEDVPAQQWEKGDIYDRSQGILFQGDGKGYGASPALEALHFGTQRIARSRSYVL